MKIVIKYISVFALVLAFAGCESFIGGDINADPNNPAEVTISAQMPAIQIALADVYGGAFSRFNSMLSQQVEGVARQWQSFNQYTGLTPNRFDSAWQNIYENVLNEVQLAQVSVDAEDLRHYRGVLQVIEAFSLMVAADVWDDIPYTEAFKGIENPNPAFDSQESIYNKVFELLDAALVELNVASETFTVPGRDDVYYDGDIDQWIKAANAIKARGLLHLDDYMGAMEAAQASFGSAADNMAFQYPDANAAGQWYRFNRDRTGDLEFHPTLRGIMVGLNDTMRLVEIDQTFVTSHTYLVPDFLQELITFREMQFIIAECAFRNGNTAAAHEAYLKGIEASFVRMGVTEDDEDAYPNYIAQASVDPGEGNLTLEHIMTQKYIAMFLQPETYGDYRRTNIPDLVPVSGSNVPVRWDYPSDEYLFNSNLAEGSVDFYNDRVWWNR